MSQPLPHPAADIAERLRQERIAPGLIPYYTLLVLTNGMLVARADLYDAWVVWAVTSTPESPVPPSWTELPDREQDEFAAATALLRKIAREVFEQAAKHVRG